MCALTLVEHGVGCISSSELPRPRQAWVQVPRQLVKSEAGVCC